MDFSEYLKLKAPEVEGEMEKWFAHWQARAEKDSKMFRPLGEEFVKAGKGGKRLRGVLTVLGFELAAGKENTDILQAAAAYELFQTGILAHDDIIDQSELRRGRPTLYKSLGGGQYGLSQAIVLGDIGFFLAMKLIAESNFPAALRAKASAEFAQTLLYTTMGELLDVEIPYRQIGKTEENVRLIYGLKTAYYTVIGPLRLGAILGGAEDELLAKIESFGKKLGMAFQIQDDILGVFGDEQTLGKSVTSDSEEGKLTILLTYVLRKGTDEQRAVLAESYGKKGLDREKFEEIKKVFIESGALEYARDEASKLLRDAEAEIPGLSRDVKQISLLESLGKLLVERNK